MQCNCIEEINYDLEEVNCKLELVKIIEDECLKRIVIPVIPIKRGLPTGETVLTGKYCPFCGVKL